MSKHVMVWPADPRSTGVRVRRGPGLLARVTDGPSLTAHLVHRGPAPSLTLRELVGRTQAAHVTGRGGAGFPFAVKLRAVADARRRPVVVVNLAEGEPASWKDSALALVAPHLILDGAAITARALGTREVRVVLPGDRTAVGLGVRAAIEERQSQDTGLEFETTQADVAFVAGQSSAVVELLSGRENRPVTTWQPAAARGLHQRPTLLSNAETFAHVALVARGSDRGTTLLTLRGDTQWPTVHEVRLGTPWHRVLEPDEIAGPLLLGGYHGTWAAPGALEHLAVSQESMSAAGLTLGAGIVIAGRRCPLHRAAEITTYLAGESAGRCGPCLNGLPRLAATMRDVARGLPRTAEVERLGAMIERRGACAHPDGTIRMARSLVHQYGDEIVVHQKGGCRFEAAAGTRRAG